MAIKKSELYSSLWESCNKLRGSMDASQYKDYVLVLLFVKYVSDKASNDPNTLIEVPQGGSFNDMKALKGKPNIGEGIDTIIAKLAEANDLKGVIDVAVFNNTEKLGKGKDMQDRLSSLVAIFEDEALDFSKNQAEGDDILGDAYEYLMRNFATESGKSKGQFYTPAEVSRIMAKVIGVSKAVSQAQTIYDPTCGSGSLLLKAADETERGLSIYGQESDNATVALAKMNMILHNNATAVIWQDNTLSTPQFKEDNGNLKTFDFVVANPPFSNKAWSIGLDPANDIYNRFEDGIPPKKNGDYAFLLHAIRSLKSKGKGVIVLPHGVLFRGGSEGSIRKNIIKRGYIKGIIGLPANLFYGTGIPACLVILDKENAEARKGIFMVDASKGFMKDGNKNRLRHQDLHKIVDVFNTQKELPKYSRMVALDEIEKNEYNLNIPRYIDSQEAEDIQDIEAHLLGDIPNKDVNDLENYWEVCPSLRNILFTASQRKDYSKLKIEHTEIKKTIYENPEFINYTKEVDDSFVKWQKKNTPILKNIGIGTKPKKLIHELSEDILDTFYNIKLIDKYDVYQHLMTYWTDTMQDDVYIIAVDGWKAEVSFAKDKNGKTKKNEWDSDLVPKRLLINRYFSSEQKVIQQLEATRDDLVRQQEELEEEHGGEEGYLEYITKSNIGKRIKEIKADYDAIGELDVLKQYLSLLDSEKETKKTIKQAEADLDTKVSSKYKQLTEDEIKTLVVDDKWMSMLYGTVRAEMNRVSQALTGRIKELAERYEAPMPKLATEVQSLTTKVEAHLQKMGFSWN